MRKFEDKVVDIVKASKNEGDPAAAKMIEESKITENKEKESKLAILKSLDQLSDDFFSDNLITVPKLFEGMGPVVKFYDQFEDGKFPSYKQYKKLYKIEF